MLCQLAEAEHHNQFQSLQLQPPAHPAPPIPRDVAYETGQQRLFFLIVISPDEVNIAEKSSFILAHCFNDALYQQQLQAILGFAFLLILSIVNENFLYVGL